HRVARMSDEHRRQVEYVARAAGHAGLGTSTEVSLPARVRPDLVIDGETAVEVQRSALTPGHAQSGTSKAIAGGMSAVLWISDKEADRAPLWMYRVPSATAHARSRQILPPLGSATVTGGVRRIVWAPCRPPERTSCIENPRKVWCGGWHLVHLPKLGVSLDALTVGIATGEYAPAHLRGHVLIASQEEVAKYGIAWRPPPVRQAAPRTTE